MADLPDGDLAPRVRVVKLRQGRRNQLNIYVQLGDEPSDSDPCLGLVLDQHAAAILCRLANERPTGQVWVQQALLSAMAEQLASS